MISRSRFTRAAATLQLRFPTPTITTAITTLITLSGSMTQEIITTTIPAGTASIRTGARQLTFAQHAIHTTRLIITTTADTGTTRLTGFTATGRSTTAHTSWRLRRQR